MASGGIRHAHFGVTVEGWLAHAWEQLVGRLDGPMAFRFVVQPLTAAVIGVRAGLRDARNGQPPFLWTLISGAGDRRALLRHGWRDVATVFLVALVLDSVYEVAVLEAFHPVRVLMVASLLALAPYAAMRGLANRAAFRGTSVISEAARRD